MIPLNCLSSEEMFFYFLGISIVLILIISFFMRLISHVAFNKAMKEFEQKYPIAIPIFKAMEDGSYWQNHEDAA